MSSTAAYDAIKARLDEWAETPVVYEDPFYELPATPAAFVFVEIFGTSYGQETLGAPGNNMWLEEGVAYLHVMIPSGQSSRDARLIADRLLTLFRERPAGALRVTESDIGKGEPGAQFAQYWAMTVTLYWHRYDIITPA